VVQSAVKAVMTGAGAQFHHSIILTTAALMRAKTSHPTVLRNRACQLQLTDPVVQSTVKAVMTGAGAQFHHSIIL